MRKILLGALVSLVVVGCAPLRMAQGQAMPKDNVRVPRELTWCEEGQWLRLDLKAAWEAPSFRGDMSSCREIFVSESALQPRPRTDDFVFGAYVDDAGKLSDVCLRRVTAGDTPKTLACIHHVLGNTRIGEGTVRPGFAVDMQLQFELRADDSR